MKNNSCTLSRERTRRDLTKIGFLCIPKCHSAVGKPVLIAESCRRIRRISAFFCWTEYTYYGDSCKYNKILYNNTILKLGFYIKLKLN